MATPPLDGNAASGRQRRLWMPTPPLDGNAASWVRVRVRVRVLG